MITRCLSVLAIAGLLALSPVAGSALQEIGWQDLMSPMNPQDDPFFDLDEEQAFALDELLMLEIVRKNTGDLPETMEDRVQELHSTLAASGRDAAVLLDKVSAFEETVAANRSAVRTEWDGTEVRIPGFVLPLEFDGDQVTEFLLVPYVGACIHTPPPPANQIIHVRANVGFRAQGLFTPVWVRGKLSIERSLQSVGLSDGTSGFEVGYALEAHEVVEYER